MSLRAAARLPAAASLQAAGLGLLVFLAGAVPHAAAIGFLGFNCGGPAVTSDAGWDYAADQPYRAGEAGYLGGEAATGYADIQATRDPDLYREWRAGDFAYRFDLPPGDYLLHLHCMDVSSFGPRQRSFDLIANGDTLLAALDLLATVGKHRAFETVRRVACPAGTLRVVCHPRIGQPTLAALGVRPIEAVPDPPAAPEGFRVLDSYGMNILHWTRPPVGGIAGHRIYVDTPTGGVRLLAENRFLDGHCFDASAAPMGPLRYQVRAVDAWDREGAPTAWLSVTARHWSASSLPVYRLTVELEDLDTLNAHALEDEAVPGWLAWDTGEAPVDVRYRGELSRHLHKKSWKIDLPGGVQIDGVHLLNLKAERDGSITIGDALGFSLLDSLDRISRETAPVHLELNEEYAGLFARVEPMGDRFLAARGLTGDLYKCDDGLRAYAEPAGYWLRYEKKTGDPDERQSLIDLILALNRANAYALRFRLPHLIDLEATLEAYAVMILTNQVDVYLRNFALFHDARTDRWTYLPFDLDRGFTLQPVALDEGTADPQRPDADYNVLLHQLLQTPQLRYRHVANLLRLAAGPLAPERVGAQAESLLARVACDGMRDVEKRDMAWNERFLETPARIATSVSRQQSDLAERCAAFLAETPVVCINEVGPDSSRGPIPGLWVEVHNFGERAVALTGCRLGPTRELPTGWPLPPDTLAPGAYRLLTPTPSPEWEPRWADWAELALHGPEGTPWDVVTRLFGGSGAQGRVPDGWLEWWGLPPSPGAANPVRAGCRVADLAWEREYPDWTDTLRFTCHLDRDRVGARAVELHVWPGAGAAWETIPLEARSPWDWSGRRLPWGQGGELEVRVAATDSVGNRVTTAAADAWQLHVAAVALPALCVNEFLAINDTTVADEFGEYDDWVELHNYGPDSVRLGGLTLSDARAEFSPWGLPELTLAPGGFLLVWTDGDPNQGPRHADFKLDGDGEEIVLRHASGEVIDARGFGPQCADQSEGRDPDGAAAWHRFPDPTPGWSNAGLAPRPTVRRAIGVVPSPARGSATLRLPVGVRTGSRLDVVAVDGRCVRRLVIGAAEVGVGEVVWDGRDTDGRRVAAGVYFLRLAGTTGGRIVLLRSRSAPE